MIWSEKKIVAIKELWAEGYSFSKIAKAVGGVSRNAVGAKLHRLGLLGNTPRRLGPSTAQTPRMPRASIIKEAAGEAPAPLGKLTELVPIGGCRWIHGDPGTDDWRMCGHNTVNNHKPWCSFHADKTHVPKARA